MNIVVQYVNNKLSYWSKIHLLCHFPLTFTQLSQSVFQNTYIV